MKRRGLLILLAIIASSLSGPSVAWAAQLPKASGPELFRAKGCVQCHSIGNVGGTKGPHLDAVGKRLKKGQIEHQIRQGGLAMPSFAEVLNPDEIHTLVEYLHTCKKNIAAPKPQQ